MSDGAASTGHVDTPSQAFCTQPHLVKEHQVHDSVGRIILGKGGLKRFSGRFRGRRYKRVRGTSGGINCTGYTFFVARYQGELRAYILARAPKGPKLA